MVRGRENADCGPAPLNDPIHIYQMKTAYFVMGPESSGTRMMTQAFCSLGIHGDFDHGQRLDNLEFSGQPERIVFRRSFPHGDDWPDPADLVRRMQAAGYEVVPVLMIRDLIANIDSQVRSGHAATHRIAHDSVVHAYQLIHTGLAEVGLYPAVVCFEPFTRSPLVRENFFHSLALEVPADMEFRDASARYRTTQDPVVLSH
jgi:hypothetical protein